MPSSPEVAIREFSRRVQQRRRALSLPAAAVADALGVSRVYYSAIENHRAIPSSSKLPLLIDALDLDRAEGEELTALVDEARQPGWWKTYSDILPDGLEVFLGIEHGAKSARIFESRLMTGILQTEEYATEVLKAAPAVSLGDLARNLEVRMRRQDRLTDDHPISLQVLLAEAVIMQQFGGPRVLRDQLSHVLDLVLAEPDRIELRIQPFDTTPLGFTLTSTAVLFKFDRPDMPAIVWTEAGENLFLYDEPETVASLELHFDQVVASSLSQEESLTRLRIRIAELESKVGSQPGNS